MMPEIVKVQRTMPCPNCGSLQRIGYPCGVCGYPVGAPVEDPLLEDAP